ncbi:MAG: arginase family protein [Kofleriaceae bacterium]
MSILDELALLLRPAGGGLYLVSTGRAEQEQLQRRLYGAASSAEVDERFREALARIGEARAVVVGIPSDIGAGFRRGANLGPQAIRSALLEELPEYPQRARELGIVDLGDVFVIPQLLRDEMLSEAQRRASQDALYPMLDEPARRAMPVSPLSIAERAFDLIFELNPKVAPLVLGGDHSTAWPVVSSLARVRADRWGIVQSDAHTDLLEHRLGIDLCFATWSWHANELFGRDGRLVQVGTRASRYDRGHWEEGLGVRQFWADACLRDPRGAIEGIIEHLQRLEVTGIYFSNDIDGTDSRWADATGTPEPGGLEPEFVVELIRRLGETVGILGGDVMEVAPPLRDRPDSTERTVGLAVRYLRETMSAIVQQRV